MDPRAEERSWSRSRFRALPRAATLERRFSSRRHGHLLPPNGIELRRNTRKPNRRRAQRAEVKAAGVVACSELFGGRLRITQERLTRTFWLRRCTEPKNE